MMIYNDIYRWQGWGGALQLGSGRCRLRIFDLTQGDSTKLAHLRPIVVIISDMPKVKMNDMSMRSCSSHIATCVARDFDIDSNRMLFVEYYPMVVYGGEDQHSIPEHFDAVEFNWHDGKAINPTWRTLRPPLLDLVRGLFELSDPRHASTGEEMPDPRK
jgi:hypothetical protein